MYILGNEPTNAAGDTGDEGGGGGGDCDKSGSNSSDRSVKCTTRRRQALDSLFGFMP